MFSKAVMNVIYGFRLLEQLSDEDLNKTFWYPASVLAPYLAYQVMHATPTGNPLMKSLRQVATEVHPEALIAFNRSPSLEATIETLCSALREWTRTKIFNQIFRRKKALTTEEQKGHLFAAAIRMNNLAVLRSCLDNDPLLLGNFQGHHWQFNMGLDVVFGFYGELAANYANEETLSLLLTAGVECVNEGLRRSLLKDAAKAGRTDIVFFVYNFQIEKSPWKSIDPHIFQRATCGSISTTLLNKALGTPSLKVYNFIETLYPQFSVLNAPLRIPASVLEAAACRGQMDTVRYLIEDDMPPCARPPGDPADWDADVSKRWYALKHALESSLYAAIENKHIDVAEYLLAHGASGTTALEFAAGYGAADFVKRLLGKGFASDGAMLKAASGGYTTIVRLLLDHVVDVDGCVDANRREENEGSRHSVPPHFRRRSFQNIWKPWARHPLVSAVEMENTAMFKDLMERQPSARFAKTMEECVLQARKSGLESMLALLASYGVDVGGSI